MITTKNNIKTFSGTQLRMIYNEKKVIAIIDGEEKTYTSTSAIHNTEEFNTEQQVLGRIEKLKIEYGPTIDI